MNERGREWMNSSKLTDLLTVTSFLVAGIGQFSEHAAGICWAAPQTSSRLTSTRQQQTIFCPTSSPCWPQSLYYLQMVQLSLSNSRRILLDTWQSEQTQNEWGTSACVSSTKESSSMLGWVLCSKLSFFNINVIYNCFPSKFSVGREGVTEKWKRKPVKVFESLSIISISYYTYSNKKQTNVMQRFPARCRPNAIRWNQF